MFARAVIIAAAVALATAHSQPEGSDYAPYDPYQQDNGYDVEYKKPEYGYKGSAYDNTYDDALEYYAHESKEDRRGLGYGETWEDNFERRNVRLRWLSFILLILTRACSTTSLQLPSR